MQYKAVAVAPEDLAAGLVFFQQIIEDSTFSWLSANIFRQDAAIPLFTPGIISRHDRISAGIIGLTGEFPAKISTDFAGIEVRPWQTVLSELVREYAGKTDILILLSNLTPAQNREIATQFPEIHLLVQAGSGSGNMEPELVNNTLLCRAEKQGKYLGLLDIDWRSSRTWGQSPEAALQERKSALDRLNWQLGRYRRKGDPLIVHKDEPEKLSAYHALVREHSGLLDEIAKLEGALAGTGNAAVPSSFANRFFALETSMPDDPAIAAIIAAANERINNIGKKSSEGTEATTSTEGPPGYAGSTACTECHQKRAAAWQNSRHAGAYETLVGQNKQFKLDCLPCHLTGVFTGREPFVFAIREGLKGVGCEACHGPSHEHAMSPGSKRPSIPDKDICLRCHTPEQDDFFDFDADVAKTGCRG